MRFYVPAKGVVMISINGIKVTPTIFPDKTSQVWKVDEEIFRDSICHILWEFEQEAEFLWLAQLKALLDSHNVRASLCIEYCPYARQDKPISNLTTFALFPFVNLLKSLKFVSLTVLDPHNENLFESMRFDVVPPTAYVKEVMRTLNADIICYPDQGAYKKYHDLYKNIFTARTIRGFKHRDPGTGEITELAIRAEGVPCEDKDILIVDDICDGGSTFVKVAKCLKMWKPRSISLFVTYGLFTKGTKILKDAGISRIFTYKGEVHDQASPPPSTL